MRRKKPYACRIGPPLPKLLRGCLARGHLLGGYHNNKLVGVLGYYLGGPKHDFTNNDVLYLYVGAILPDYQLTRLFYHGLLFILQVYQGTAVIHIRLQAEKANPYTNKLYGRFAHPIAEEKSPRGVPVITYGGSIENAITYLSRGKRSKPAKATPRQFYNDRILTVSRIKPLELHWKNQQTVGVIA